MLSTLLSNPYRFEVYSLSLLSVFVLGFAAYRRVGFWLAAFWLVVMVSGIRVSIGMRLLAPMSVLQSAILDRCVLESLTFFSIATIAFLTIKSTTLILAVRLMALLNLLLLLAPPHYGLLTNYSMSGTFAALCMPFLIGWKPLKGGFLVVLTLCILPFLRASNPLAIAAVELAASAFFLRRSLFFPIIGAGAALSALGIWLMGGLPVFLSGTGRYNLWADSWKLWKGIGSYWLGTGTGSFPALARSILQGDGTVFFPFMHSDWQQVVFEQGVLGGITAIGLFGSLLVRSRSAPLLWVFWSGWGVACVSNMPIRYAPGGLLALAAVRLTLEARKAPRVL